MALQATHGVDEGLKAEATCVEGLDRVLAKPLPLGPVPQLPLLIVREEREVVVVLRVSLRHLSPIERIENLIVRFEFDGRLNRIGV